MSINLKENLDSRVKDVSRMLGVDKRELIDRAVVFYLDSIQKTMELKKELDAWDMVSDETLKFSEQSNFKKR